MRKILFLTTILFLPLSAYAQIEVSDEIIQKALDDLKPAFCKNDLKQAMQVVLECYEKVDTSNNGKDANQCILEDIATLGAIKYQFGRNTTGLYSDFVKPENIKARTTKYSSLFMSDNAVSQDKLSKLTVGTAKLLLTLQKEKCFDPSKLK